MKAANLLDNLTAGMRRYLEKASYQQPVTLQASPVRNAYNPNNLSPMIGKKSPRESLDDFDFLLRESIDRRSKQMKKSMRQSSKVIHQSSGKNTDFNLDDLLNELDGDGNKQEKRGIPGIYVN